MLGVLCAITKIVTNEGLRQRIEERWPRFKESNLKALELGLKAGEAALASQ
jgi:Pyruvate/2-oxoacid:ferredoxin oxidoreductase gamma subunit